MINIFFLSLIIFYLSHILLINWKSVNVFLIDKDFNKIQSFHNKATIRSGGILIFIVWIFYTIFYQNNLTNLSFLIYLSLVNFIIGLSADTNFIQSPFKRFLMMLVTNIAIIFYFDFYIKEFDVLFLDYLNSFLIFKIILVFLALFFIINGSNLIDGFNGLLAIHMFIIISIIFFICQTINSELNFQNYLIFLIILNFLFLTLNFPNAKIFLGDCGAYFFGSQVACISIYLSNNYEIISSFFIANILFYIFFEIFFSVFRKIIQKKNPFFPDNKHMHMLLFNVLRKNTKFANPVTSVIINFIFFITIVPSYIYFDDNFICKWIFIMQIIIYMTLYIFLIKKNKDANIYS